MHYILFEVGIDFRSCFFYIYKAFVHVLFSLQRSVPWCVFYLTNGFRPCDLICILPPNQFANQGLVCILPCKSVSESSNNSHFIL